MNKEKERVSILNAFDGLMALIVVFVVLFLVMPSFINQESAQKPVVVTLRVEKNIDIYPKDPTDFGTPFLNSINQEVEILGVEEVKENGKKTLNITLLGKGDISGDIYIFNGARILVGQKGELRSNYFAQGVITDIKYEDN